MESVSLDLVAVYASLFVHRWDQYALQQRDGSYWRVREPLSYELLAAHLAGLCTVGTYLLDSESRCMFAVFDADGEHGLEQLAALSVELFGQGIPTILEASRRGGHLWVHLDRPTDAGAVRAWLLPYAVTLGVEFYPKQDVLAPGGSGSLVRLPLGMHRRSRGWYPFVQLAPMGELVPVGETVEACCVWVCQAVQRVVVPASVVSACSSACASSGQTVSWQAIGQTMPSFGRGSIRAWCQAQDILSVIGRYVALDSRGVGSCPFKAHHYRGDRHPSFQVFGGVDSHWYCYTWRRAGDLFDFICLYHQITPQEGWRQLQEGTLL